jgi:hypothetical protein
MICSTRSVNARAQGGLTPHWRKSDYDEVCAASAGYTGGTDLVEQAP